MIYISSYNVRYRVTKTYTTLHYTCRYFTTLVDTYNLLYPSIRQPFKNAFTQNYINF